MLSVPGRHGRSQVYHTLPSRAAPFPPSCPSQSPFAAALDTGGQHNLASIQQLWVCCSCALHCDLEPIGWAAGLQGLNEAYLQPNKMSLWEVGGSSERWSRQVHMRKSSAQGLHSRHLMASGKRVNNG